MYHGSILNGRRGARRFSRLRNRKDDRDFSRYFRADEDQPSDLAMAWLGRSGGVTDGDDGDAADNLSIPAGFTFFGQFIDHDITLTNGAGSLGTPDNFRKLTNERDPALNLDSVYGDGPRSRESRNLYDDDFKFLLAPDLADLAREGTPPASGDPAMRAAIIGDPRNDENLIISQLHLTFLRLHNKLMDEAGTYDDATFQTVRRTIIHSYQHIVLEEYLRLHVPADVLAFIRGDQLGLFSAIVRKSHGALSMPVEFSAAAFRFGHSQVRGGYLVNEDRNNGNPFGAQLFGTGGADLNGGFTRGFAESVDWALFFGTPGQAPASIRNKSRVVDAKLSGPLFRLRAPGISAPPISLSERNLRRGRDHMLISGQEVADFFARAGVPGARVLMPDELGLPAEVDMPGVRDPDFADDEVTPSVRDKTPLWYYILKEAELQHPAQAGGTPASPALGPVGGALVAETLVGLLRHDSGDRDTRFLEPVKPIDVSVDADNSALIDPRFDTMAKLTGFAGVKVEGEL